MRVHDITRCDWHVTMCHILSPRHDRDRHEGALVFQLVPAFALRDPMRKFCILQEYVVVLMRLEKASTFTLAVLNIAQHG